MKIGIVIPCYNGHNSLEKTLSEILEYEAPENIILVDDGSAPILKPKCTNIRIVRHNSNKGLGAAVTSGLRYGLDNGFESFIKMDSDGQMKAKYITEFKKYLENKADLVTGLFDSQLTPRPILFDDWLFSLMVSFVTGNKVCGVLSEFRGFSSSMAMKYIESEFSNWDSPFVHFYYDGRIEIVPQSVQVNEVSSFSLSAMIALRSGFYKHALKYRGRSHLKVFIASLILGLHLIYNLIFNLKYNGKKF